MVTSGAGTQCQRYDDQTDMPSASAAVHAMPAQSPNATPHIGLIANRDQRH
jgi:hypothetical protein